MVIFLPLLDVVFFVIEAWKKIEPSGNERFYCTGVIPAVVKGVGPTLLSFLIPS